MQWNPDELSQIDKFVESADPVAKGGALLGVGLCCAKVRNDMDPAFALLSDYLNESVAQPKVCYAANDDAVVCYSTARLMPAV